MNEAVLEGVRVNTVDSFQGAEQDIVIVLVNKGGEGASFTSDHRRLNVTLTRAKHHCVFIGSVQQMRETEVWTKVIAACDVKDAADYLMEG